MPLVEFSSTSAYGNYSSFTARIDHKALFHLNFLSRKFLKLYYIRDENIEIILKNKYINAFSLKQIIKIICRMKFDELEIAKSLKLIIYI